jgi:hypothetical protein
MMKEQQILERPNVIIYLIRISSWQVIKFCFLNRDQYIEYNIERLPINNLTKNVNETIILSDCPIDASD